MKKIAVLGYGTVGSGVVELFYKNREKIEQKAGCALEIGYILDLRDFPDSPYADKFVKDMGVILADPDVTAVAECMGGVEPAYSYLMQCLERGISAATSNKELIAQKGDKLLAMAKAHACNCFFEASVGGAIPIIRPLHRCLAANDITAMYGILNGTTNFILNQMLSEGMSFDDALKQAQDLGYAERNPGADVDGIDACRKICILSSLVYGKHVYPDSISTTGIRSVSLEDAAAADALDGAIKLIAAVERLEDGRILPLVSPMYVPHANLLSRVDGVFNCLEVCGDAVDRTYLCGRGAGKLPTASAVMGDVIEAVKHQCNVFSQDWASAEDQSFVAQPEAQTCGMFIRLTEDYGAETIANAVAPVIGDADVDMIANACVISARLDAAQRDAICKAIADGGMQIAAWLPVLDA